ncbi:MAG TPA: MTAP family purine nucleoside phosphorylase [Tepidisphaeraceae bacterium]|nr:MTAP family purine nucleoside phosphorylase [Tepidisphaeraceae bacterium]
MSSIKIGLIGGTGLGQALGAETDGKRHELDTPFGRPSDAIVETEWHGLPLLLLARHGPGHLLNPSQVPSRANIYALKQLGCTHILASGAVGSLREDFRPRDLVIPDQIIDKTTNRPGTFFEHAAVHVEFAEPFCPVLHSILAEAGALIQTEQRDSDNSPDQQPQQSFSVHSRGCYVCMEGPAFSTRAESLMHRLWGGDLIGMTAMPEAKLAREAEIAYGLVALVTDYDCWRAQPTAAKHSAPAKVDLLKEIIHNLESATANAIRLLKRSVALIADRRDDLPPSPAHSALELAIWSEKARLNPQEIKRLAPLWQRYF